jgi:hypothetical protein
MSELQDVLLTLEECGAEITGPKKPASPSTVRRRFGHLIVHPTPGASRIWQGELRAEIRAATRRTSSGEAA